MSFTDEGSPQLTLYDLTDSNKTGPRGPRVEDLTFNTKFSLSKLIEHIDSSECETTELFEAISTPYSVALWAVSAIMESPTAAELLFSLPLEDWQISLSATEQGYSYDEADCHLMLGLDGFSPEDIARNQFACNALLLDLGQALREIWHDTYCDAVLSTLRLEELIRWERFRRADTALFTIVFAKELSAENGFEALWNHVLTHGEGDLALTYDACEKNLFGHPMAESKLLARVFTDWFSDVTRIDEGDRFALDQMDRLREEEDTEASAKRKTRIDAALINSYFTLPGKGAYLSSVARDLAENCEYAKLYSDINEMYLMQIIDDMDPDNFGDLVFGDAVLGRLFTA